ncbi:MAG: hypothetical protein LBD50_02000 [Rickettsiales bacterium]|jgi:hypothetical protein|nr:hypothetical protein [Rickettsiales bacterium]
MVAQTLKTNLNVVKFQNGEQLWFWFLHSKKVQNGFKIKSFSNQKYACELLDLEILITKLYLSGQISDEQLAVMKEFGDKQRAPRQHVWNENRKAAVWNSAMQTLESAARNKEWIE